MIIKTSPGPWDLKLDERFSFGRCNSEESYGDHGGIYDVDGKPVVGCDEYDVFWGPQREGNARLMAAAPQLLQALEIILAADPDQRVGAWFGAIKNVLRNAQLEKQET